jgi:hypothetical protein
MARFRPEPTQEQGFDASMNEFSAMIDDRIADGTISQISVGLPDEQFARVVQAVERLEATMGRLRRDLTTSRMLRDQLMGNRAPEASAYIIEDDIRLIIGRGNIPMRRREEHE